MTQYVKRLPTVHAMTAADFKMMCKTLLMKWHPDWVKKLMDNGELEIMPDERVRINNTFVKPQQYIVITEDDKLLIMEPECFAKEYSKI